MSFEDTDSVLRLLNLGPRSAEWLADVGVRTVGDLRAMGAVLAYRIVKDRRDDATIHLLYALYGALEGKRWDRLTDDEKASLKKALETEVSRSFEPRRPAPGPNQ
jgi:DNA transformation protein and related proteins